MEHYQKQQINMKIGGEDRPVKFGLNQSFEYCEIRNISITEMNTDISNISNGNGSQIRDLIWSALKDGARYEKVDFNFTNFDVGDWLESTEDNVIQDFFSNYLLSLPKSNKDEDVKKNNQTEKKT